MRNPFLPFSPGDYGMAYVPRGGGKGGSSAPTNTTSQVNQSNLPEYARPYYESLMQRAQNTANDGYQAYGGQRVADFSGMQNEAMRRFVNEDLGAWQRNVGQAQTAAGQANFDPSQVTAGQWTDPGVASQYMSPYMQNVVDANKREATRDATIQEQNLNAQAQQAGAFGGYRHGIVQAENTRNLNQQLQDIQAKGLQSAYDTGLGAFNADRQASMGAQMANNQFGFDAAQTDLARSQMYAGLGQLQSQLRGADIQSLLNMGNMQQAQSQAGMDLAYNDFINQRDYDRQNLNWLSGILRGVPISANTSVSQYQAPPSAMSQVAGLGLGAAGLYSMLK